MRNLFCQCLILFVLLTQPAILQAQPIIHHEIRVRLHPEQHRLEVEDTITFPATGLRSVKGGVAFALHRGLQPVSLTPGVKIVQEKFVPPSIALHIRSDILPDDTIPLDYFTVTLPPGVNTYVVKYQGEINHPIRQHGEEYARSFSETPGIISSEGIFLGGTSFWYPWFSDDEVSFTLDVQLPEGWEAVSQGERTRHTHSSSEQRADASVGKGSLHSASPMEERGSGSASPNTGRGGIGGSAEGGPHGPPQKMIGRSPTIVRWESPAPQEGIYLVGGRYTEYNRTAGALQVMAFLRTPDQELASKYLEMTGRYLEMYRKLIGPYPYKKFALVENFWETGYGMPSFTLMGSKVIRLPFILYSSYPHEILHNWWGNSVYVDEEGGNWSEGLTTYLADHLIEEQRGTGVEYRRATLQKYRDYVKDPAQDFSLTEFRSRSSSVTEAVGYGKTLMFFHMLRQRLGDEGFIHTLQKFYRDFQFKHAGFGDLKTAFSKTPGQDLEVEFSQWIDRAGAPVLQVSQTSALRQEKGFRLTSVIEQIQRGPFYRLQIPVAVHLEGKEQAYQTTVLMDSQRLELNLQVPERPLRLEIDPEFDLFRRLDRSEVPPALSQAFGASSVLAVLPFKANKEILGGYRRLAESWKRSRLGELEIVLDSEIDRLPLDRAIWLFGWENKFIPDLKDAVKDYPVSFAENTLEVGGTRLARDKHSAVLTTRHPANPDLALAWLATDRVLAMPGLGQKLSHYSKYSYLGFQGDEPVNILKGEWPVGDSALSVAVAQWDGYQVGEHKARLAPRPALVSLP